MRWALQDAGVTPAAIQYINAHGSGTLQNDPAETAAIKRCSEKHAYTVPISSTKSMIGHCFGGGGALEAIATVMSVYTDIIHPTINLERPDPACDLDYVPNTRPAQRGRTSLCPTPSAWAGRTPAWCSGNIPPRIRGICPSMRVTYQHQTDQAPGEVRHLCEPWAASQSLPAAWSPPSSLASFGSLWSPSSLGFLLAQYGNYNLRRYGRSPRPDQILEESMKGFDDRYHLYCLVAARAVRPARPRRGCTASSPATRPARSACNGLAMEDWLQPQPRADDVQPGRDGQPDPGGPGRTPPS